MFKGLLDGVHTVAIKIFAGEAGNTDKDGLNKEIHLLRSCRNSHIVQVNFPALFRVSLQAVTVATMSK